MRFRFNEDEDETGEEKEEEVRHFHWANTILIIFLFFSFLINFMIILIHSKQKSLRRGFFTIIFAQIISEAIISISLLLINIIYLSDIERGTWFIIFPILFNFAHVTDIIYNTRIMLYLMTLDQRREERINYCENEDDNFDSKESDLSRQSTIGLKAHSFKSFHILAIFLSTIHTILYIFKLFNDDKDIEDEKWKWFYYFMSGSDGAERFAFYVFHFIFFILSIPYLILSLNKEKISEHILLKRFSLYCIFSSLVSLLFPAAIIIDYTIGEHLDDIFIILMFAFIVYLSVTLIFRVNCYYIQFILEENGKKFCSKFITGLKILFCCKDIPSPNFIDLNSSFVYHSLANFNDFLQELSTDIGEEKNEEKKEDQLENKN